jgi:lipid-binding SYLF domain-containing protein
VADDWKKWNNPLSFTLGSTIRQATSTLEHMCHDNQDNDNTKLNDQSIPLDLLHCAKGLCFLTVLKAGLVVSGRVGTGLLVARLDNRWSAPCALGTVGMGWGMLAGGDITHYLVVLTTHEAVEALLGGTVQLGAELGVAVGPVGRTGSSHVSASNTDWAVHPAYSYAHSQGLFVGIRLEGSVLSTRHDGNAIFYGQKHILWSEIYADANFGFATPKGGRTLVPSLDQGLGYRNPRWSLLT